MAVVASFKQACPSCEAMISIKESMIGKKVECTKCKDKFIAERPDEDEVVEVDEAPAKKTTKTDTKKNTSVMTKALPKKSKVDVDDHGSNGKSNGKANGKPAKGKADRDDDDSDDDDSGKKSKKKKKEGGGVSKLTIGIGLAVVGVLILSVAAFFLLSGGGGGGGGNVAVRPGTGGPGPNPGNGNEEDPDKDKEKDTKPKVTPRPKEAPATPLTEAELAKLTNLLPPDTDHVFHAFFKDLFHANGPLYESVFGASGLNDPSVTSKLGFSISAIDDLICAEKYTPQGWKYTVIHFQENLKEEDLKTALKLKASAAPINGMVWYQMAEANPWLDTLARFRVGISNQLRAFDGRSADRPTFVRIHNPQTLIIGDEAPIKALLAARGQFPLRGVPTPTTPLPKPKPGPDPMQPMPGTNPMPMPMPMGGETGSPSPMPMPPRGGKGSPRGESPTPTQPMPMPGTSPGPGPMDEQPMPPRGGGKGNPRGESPMPMQPGSPTPMQPGPGPMDGTPNPNPNPNPPKNPQPEPVPVMGDFYMTIRPTLKAMLEKMETRNSDLEKVLFSSATDMDASRIVATSPEFSNMVVRRPRQVWDITLLLNERKPRIRMLGTGLIQGEQLKYQLRNELTCAQELDAKEFHREMMDKSTPTIATFVKRWTNHEITLAMPPEEKKLPLPDPMNPNPDPTKQQPEPKKEPEILKSQISIAQDSTTLEFKVDLIPDNWSRMAIETVATLAASSLRGEMEAAMNASLRHVLANAGKVLAEKGVASQEVAAGVYPPGAFRRPDAVLRTDREPKNRISWMTSLLPHLGHQNLFDRVKFDQSWRSPGNWTAGNTLVPQFLDPRYPDSARLIGVSDSPIDFAATHFVGIAGVGLDAASYKRGDPATKHKQGILGYDDSAKLSDVIAGRGQANTILMIQVPHDGATGVSPWIAGGGATLRGVPEKNSIAPFVLSTDRNGKLISHDNKRGTFALMSDGSVRFIDQNVSDEVFKAMCTLDGPNPEGFKIDRDPNTPLVPANGKPVEKKVEAKVPAKKAPEKAPEANDLSAFQGNWKMKSSVFNGESFPGEVLSKIAVTISGNKMTTTTPTGEKIETTFTIDTSVVPHRIDITPAGGDQKELGIFEFTGGDLRICSTPIPGAPRPLAFASKTGDQTGIAVMTKAK